MIIDDTQRYGLLVATGAEVHGRELVISGTRADDAGAFGRGIAAESGTVEVTRVLLSGNHDVAVRDGRVRDRTTGQGLAVQSGATAVVTRGLFSNNRDVAVLVSGASTEVALSDVVAEETQERESDAAFGRGLVIWQGARGTVSRALLSHNRGIGILVNGEDTTATFSDLVVRSTQARASDGTFGHGLTVTDGAATVITRAELSQNREFGVLVRGPGAAATLSDVVVVGTRGRQSDSHFGQGLHVQGAAVADLSRASLSRNHEAGVVALGEGTSITLSDVVVEDTLGRESDGLFGCGVSFEGGVRAVVGRLLVAANREAAVITDGAGTTTTLSDVVVEGTWGRQSDDAGGRGLVVQLAARTEVSRARLWRNHGFGVLVGGEGAWARLTDVVVGQTDEQPCGSTTCADSPYGVGLAVFAGTLEAARFARA